MTSERQHICSERPKGRAAPSSRGYGEMALSPKSGGWSLQGEQSSPCRRAMALEEMVEGLGEDGGTDEGGELGATWQGSLYLGLRPLVLSQGRQTGEH